MRYAIYIVILILAAIALFPVMKKAGKILLKTFSKIEKAAK